MNTADKLALPEDAAVDYAAHYIGILEAVVAVLAIKQGMNPETMMGNVIETITEQAGMETSVTESIIRQRWSGRDIRAGQLAAATFPSDLSKPPPEHEPPPPLDIAKSYASYKERRKG